MDRITTQHLDAMLARMVRTTGAPTGPLWVDGRARVGALFIESGSLTYGRAWRLSQMCNEAGGQRDILRARSARELWNAMHTWLEGYEAAKRGDV